MSGADARASAAPPPPGFAGRSSSPSKLGEDFAASAALLAGVVGVTLGWRPDEFWQATPAEVLGIARALAGDTAPGVDRAVLDALWERWPDG